MDRLRVDSKCLCCLERLLMSRIPGGVVGQHQELGLMTCSQDALGKDAGAKLDVIVMAADERKSQHSPVPVGRA